MRSALVLLLREKGEIGWRISGGSKKYSGIVIKGRGQGNFSETIFSRRWAFE